MLHADRHALLLGVADDLLETLDAVVETLVARNLAALGIVRVAPLVAGESDNAGTTGVDAGVNCRLGALDDFFVILGIVEAFFEGRDPASRCRR